MVLLLIAGIGCLALLRFPVDTGTRGDGARAPRRAQQRARGLGDAALAPSGTRRSVIVAGARSVPRRTFIGGSGASKRTTRSRASLPARGLTPLHGGAVHGSAGGSTVVGFIVGFVIAHGAGRVLLAIVFGAAGLLGPGLPAEQGGSATRRPHRPELPHVRRSARVDHRGRHELRRRGHIPRGRRRWAARGGDAAEC